MLCSKSFLKIGFGILSLVFCSVLFSSPSYAIDNISVSHSSVFVDQPVFSSCDTSCLNQFSYLIVSGLSNISQSAILLRSPLSSVSSSYGIFRISGYYNLNDNSSYQWTNIISLPYDSSWQYTFLTFSNNYNFSSPVTFTLSNSLPSSDVSGTLDITENGQFDVSSYQFANVQVPEVLVEGDYHDDLIKINNSILVCGAILLVLYFFYCIYRMIIKGVK